MRALIGLTLLLVGAAACSGSADVSVGRNDPVPSGTDRSAGNSSAPWAGPTGVCDGQICRIGSCTLTIGSCTPNTTMSASGCPDVPDSCSDEVEPVCGCDGRSYANACEAARATGGVLTQMPCE